MVWNAPLEEAYEQVLLPDLEFAIENLPLEWPIAETGRVTRGAANMLAAKAHFARGDCAAALPHLDDIPTNRHRRPRGSLMG